MTWEAVSWEDLREGDIVRYVEKSTEMVVLEVTTTHVEVCPPKAISPTDIRSVPHCAEGVEGFAFERKAAPARAAAPYTFWEDPTSKAVYAKAQDGALCRVRQGVAFVMPDRLLEEHCPGLMARLVPFIPPPGRGA